MNKNNKCFDEKELERLRISELKYRAFFESAHDAFLVLKGNVFVDCNSRALEMFGCRKDELIGSTPWHFSPPVQPDGSSSQSRAKMYINDALKGKPSFFYWKHCKLNGEQFDAEVSLSRFQVEEDLLLITIVRNVTERKVTEEKLQESQRKLHDIIQFLPDATFVVDKEQKVIAWNKAMEEMSGVKAEDIIGKGDYIYAVPFYGERRPVLIDLLINPDPEIEKKYDSIWRKGGKIYGEAFAKALYGGRGAHIWATASLLYGVDGKINGAIESVRDISDFKLFQEALKESEERYREILETIEDGYYEVDLAGNFIFFNDSLCKIGGYSRDELLNKSYKMLYLNPEVVYKTYNKVYRTGKPEKIIGWPMIKKDGSEAFVEVSVSLKRDKKGNRVGFRGVARDVTERKRAEERVRALQEELKMILDSVPNLIWSIEKRTTVGFVNRTCAEFFSVPCDELEGKSIREVFFPKDAECIEKYIQEIYKLRSPLMFEKKYTDISGKERWLDLIMTPIFGEKGEIIKIICTATEFTERKLAENQLKYMSIHDHLTGLYNRMYFEEELKRIDNARHYPITIVVCDVDGLKLINDTLGHRRGDELLKAVARVIKKPLRSSDVVARMGGDEFALVIPNSDENVAKEICSRIYKAIEEHNQRQPDLPISISMGMASASKPVSTLDDLYRQADDQMYQEKLKNSATLQDDMLKAFLKALASKDNIDKGHAVRLQELVLALGKAAGVSVSEIGDLLLLAQVHDIGLVAVSDDILLKEGKLTEGEWGEIKRHPEVGYRIACSTPKLAHIARLILEHHEWWNGKGYPRGLKEGEIHICSRILALVDAYDAMLYPRPYKKPVSPEEALEEIIKMRGIQFDPYLVDLFLELKGKPCKGG